MDRLRQAEPLQAVAVERLTEVQVAVARRDSWLAEHPSEVAWEADLAERVADRRRDLAVAAERDQPDHVVRLLGPPPEDLDARELWLTGAGAIEGYRENGESTLKWSDESTTCGACKPLPGRTSNRISCPRSSSWTGGAQPMRPTPMGSISGCREGGVLRSGGGDLGCVPWRGE